MFYDLDSDLDRRKEEKRKLSSGFGLRSVGMRVCCVCRQTASGTKTAAVFSVRCDGEVLRRFLVSKWYYAMFRSDSDAERIQ
jgi:hypothetical protein